MSKAHKNRREPKVACQPREKAPRTKENPTSTEKESPAWQFCLCDKDHTSWGWDKLKLQEYNDIFDKIKSFEGLSWNEIKSQSGGKAKGKGTNHHSIPIDKFTKSAKDRLAELNLDDRDELFSLRLSNTIRLYGIKEGRVLKFIWYDPHHGNKEGAYPTSK